MENEKLKTGTTTVGLSTNTAVVFAADKRATMGNLIAHKFVEKVVPITDSIIMTIAGLVGDAQMLIKYLKSEIRLYELRSGDKITTKAAATLLGNILYGNRFSPFPFYVQLLLGGKDREGFSLYTLTPDGAVIIDKYIATGSGSLLAYSQLDSSYKQDMTEEEAIKLVVKAVNAAMKRDIYSGEGIDVFTISDKGLIKVPKDKISSAIPK